MTAIEQLPQEILKEYSDFKILPDGKICAIAKFLFTYGIVIDIHESGYEDRYCYHSYQDAKTALEQWDGAGDPNGWHRHLNTGRRRNLDTGEEWIQF